MTAWVRGFALAIPVSRARRRPALAAHVIGPTASGLAIKRRRYESGLHLIVSGELDRVTAGQLQQQCERVDPAELPTVLLDLADVTLTDSSGLDVLFAAFEHFGERLVVIIGPPCAQTVDIANVRGRLPIIEG